MDEHIPRVITEELVRRGVDALTAQADGWAGSVDSALLDRATALGRVVVTHDEDFQIEAARRQRRGEPFAGVVFVDLNRITIGRVVSDLQTIGLAGEPADFLNRLEYLPL